MKKLVVELLPEHERALGALRQALPPEVKKGVNEVGLVQIAIDSMHRLLRCALVRQNPQAIDTLKQIGYDPDDFIRKD